MAFDSNGSTRPPNTPVRSAAMAARTTANMVEVIVDGEVRWLANLPTLSATPLNDWPVYGDFPQTPMISRDQWKPVSYNHYFPPVKDQDGIGACNAFAAVNAAEATRKVAGLPDISLSCGYLYGNINGQQDQGSMLEDALEWMKQHGTCPTAIVPDLAWKSNQWSNEASASANLYRFIEAYWCPTFDHIASAIQSGFFCDTGIMWADGDNVDGDGWIPERPRGNQGGHAIARGSLDNRSGKWGLGGPNSWSTRWGVAGYMVIPEVRFKSAVGGHWALRSMIDTGGSDAPTPVS